MSLIGKWYNFDIETIKFMVSNFEHEFKSLYVNTLFQKTNFNTAKTFMKDKYLVNLQTQLLKTA